MKIAALVSSAVFQLFLVAVFLGVAFDSGGSPHVRTDPQTAGAVFALLGAGCALTLLTLAFCLFAEEPS